ALGMIASNMTNAAKLISEVVYVESPTDTDSDGRPDRIYVSIDRPSLEKKLPTIFYISPYALGGNNISMHSVDVDLLPQDEKIYKSAGIKSHPQMMSKNAIEPLRLSAARYATVRAHSLGTGRSSGCPTVGDM